MRTGAQALFSRGIGGQFGGWPSAQVWWIVALLGLASMAAFTLATVPPPMRSPDSSSYLAWSPTRTPGYPLFLWLVGWVDPGYSRLPHIQMGLMVAAAAFLAQAGARLGGPWWIWALAGLATVANPFLWRFAWQMQTESLFITLVMVFLGCVALALRHRPAGLGWLAAASFALGAAILVRPVGYALLGVAPLVGMVWYGRRPSAIAAAIGPAIALLLAVSAWNFVSKGYFATQVFGGYNILGQVTLLVRPDIETGNPVAETAARRIAAELSHIRERLPREFSSWKTYYWMTTYAYNPALYDHALPAITDVITAVGTDASAAEEAKLINAQGWSIAAATIRQSPADYAYHVATHFAALWTLPAITSPESAAALRTRLCGEAFKDFYCRADQLDAMRIELSSILVLLKDGLFIALMLGSFLLIIAAALWRAAPPVLIFAAVAALCVNANHLLVALVEAGIPRYAIAMWPALVVMVGAVGGTLVDRSRETDGLFGPLPER